MAEATLEVPQGHLSAFRRATVSEVAFDTDWAEECRSKYEADTFFAGDNAASIPADDVVGSAKQLQHTSRILSQLDLEGVATTLADEDVEALAHITRRMAEQVGQELAERLNTVPLTNDDLLDTHRMTSQIMWATRESVRLFNEGQESRAKAEEE